MACGERREITERYLTVCWASIFPYPCHKTRTRTVYCYDFSSMRSKCFGFYEVHHGCCDGREYRWTSRCFGWFTAYFFNVRVCVSSRLTDRGKCGTSIPPGGEIPYGHELLGGVAASERDPDGEVTESHATIYMKGVCWPCVVVKASILVLAAYGLWELVGGFILGGSAGFFSALS